MIVTDINIDVNVTWYNDLAVFKELQQNNSHVIGKTFSEHF